VLLFSRVEEQKKKLHNVIMKKNQYKIWHIAYRDNSQFDITVYVAGHIFQ